MSFRRTLETGKTGWEWLIDLEIGLIIGAAFTGMRSRPVSIVQNAGGLPFLGRVLIVMGNVTRHGRETWTRWLATIPLSYDQPTRPTDYVMSLIFFSLINSLTPSGKLNGLEHVPRVWLKRELLNSYSPLILILYSDRRAAGVNIIIQSKAHSTLYSSNCS